MCKVSIVMPVYNVDKYIKHSLDCLINQTLKEIEIICVDDGSVDDSVNIIQQYAQKDSRVILKQINHSFAGGARNEGLRIATGDYIMFLDPDDYYDVTMVETLYNKIVEDDTDMTICGIYSVFENEIIYNPPSYIPYINTFLDNKVFSSKDLKDYIWFFLVYPYNKIYKREFIVKNQIQFQPIKNTNDASFAFEVLIAAERISLINKAFYYYRHFRPNNTRLTKGTSLECVIEAYKHSYNQCRKYPSFCGVENGLIAILLSSLVWHTKIYCTTYNKSQEFFYNYTKNKLEEYYANNNEIKKLLKNLIFCDYILTNIILKNNYRSYIKIVNKKNILKTYFNISDYSKKFLFITLYKHHYNTCKERYSILGTTLYKKMIKESKISRHILGIKVSESKILTSCTKMYLTYITNRLDKAKLIYILNEHIGETFLLSNKLNQLLKNDNEKSVCFVLQNNVQKQVLDLFANKELIDSIITVPTDAQLRKDIALYLGKKKEINGSTIRVLMPELFWRTEKVKNNHYLDMICKELNIPNDTIRIKPNINDEEKENILKTAQDKGLDVNNFIYILPESISVNPIPMQFWQKIIQALKNLGYDIYLNITNKRNRIDGTKTFHTNIKEAWTLAQKAKCIIGMRSGLIELLVSNKNVPAYILYNGENRIVRNSIKAINGLDHPYLHEYDFSDNSISEEYLINQIIKEVK